MIAAARQQGLTVERIVLSAEGMNELLESVFFEVHSQLIGKVGTYQGIPIDTDPNQVYAVKIKCQRGMYPVTYDENDLEYNHEARQWKLR